jgi:hypothetical protein
MEMAGQASDKSSGARARSLIGFNTAGSISGALLAAFALLAWLGLGEVWLLPASS